MKIATWNVNSLTVRLPQVLDWIRERNPDVLCLQETKLPDERFPVGAFRDAGYHAIYRGQPTYNGVAIISRAPSSEILSAFPDWDDPEKRLLAARVGDLRVINVYVPNGQDLGTEKFRYKLRWLSHLQRLVSTEKDQFPHLVLLGDFNIAPEDRDVYDPASLANQIFCSAEERAVIASIQDENLDDAFRQVHTESGLYSWWDYRAGMFRRNLGLRIDLIFTSRTLRPSLVAGEIDRHVRKNDRPSDHVPVWIDLDLGQSS
jgi:exodeoxyribonuclease-3